MMILSSKSVVEKKKTVISSSRSKLGLSKLYIENLKGSDNLRNSLISINIYGI